MSCISIIDCTLRDGGYVNNWKFDVNFQKSLVKSLIVSKVENIEVGFISRLSGSDEEGTHFYTIERASQFLKENAFNIQNSKFLVMMRLGEYNPDELSYCDKVENCVTGIRVMVAKDEIEVAVPVLKKILEKGYDLYIQPTIISNYTDEEVVRMLNIFSVLNYRGISIVDTFGALCEEDIKRFVYLFDKYANKDAVIGLHSHDNLGIAYKNALAFVNSVNSNRDVFVDTSVTGLGRGGGNLSTEIFLTYLKKSKGREYVVFPVNDFAARFMPDIKRNVNQNDFYAYILTAKKNMHPNYATYLITKGYSRTDIVQILELIMPDKYAAFDYKYIESLCEIYRIKV